MKVISYLTTRQPRMQTDVSTPVVQNCMARLIVPNALGLHARPAARLVKTAQAFDTEILMECDGRCVNAKSILGIMTLGAKQGAIINMTAKGHDAVAAVRALECVFICFYHELESAAKLAYRGAATLLADAGRSQAVVADTAELRTS